MWRPTAWCCSAELLRQNYLDLRLLILSKTSRSIVVEVVSSISMAPISKKRRNIEDEVRRPKKKIRKFKKQKEYHSSSEDDDDAPDQHSALKSQSEGTNKQKQPAAIVKHSLAPRRRQQPSIAALTDHDAQTKDNSTSEEEIDEGDEEEQSDEGDTELQINTALNMSAHDDSEGEEVDDEESADSDDGVAINGLDDLEDEDDQDEDLVDEFGSDDPSETAGMGRKKRNDPTAFATSISKILTTKLSTQKRVDPILSRSKTADEANKALADSKLDTKARAAIRAEKKSILERGRVSDVLGLETPGVDTGAIMEEEKRLKKTAQRGVVKLFNAVRAAQVKAEEAGRAAREEGVVGMHKREERINEMSKEGFLDLISRGGKTPIET